MEDFQPSVRSWHCLRSEAQEYELHTATIRCNIMRADSMTAKARQALVLALLLGAVAAPLARAQTFTVIHNFTGGSDGANPLAGFLIDGTTLYGTASSGGSSRHGVVFAMRSEERRVGKECRSRW